MGARLQGDIYSLDGVKFTVTLDVAGYAGAASDFNLRELKINYSGDDKDIHTPILTSSASVTFTVPDATIAGVFAGLTGAAEEAYRLRINKDDALFWCGVVIPDEVIEQDAKYPYDFSIEATDGLGRLKDKDYTGVGAQWEGKATFLQHLYNVLSFVPTSDFWGGTDVYLSTRQQIFGSTQASGEAVTPLTTARFDHKVFRELDSKGLLKYENAFEVLGVLCRAYASRFYLADGAYRFEQVTQYASQAATITIKNFDTAAGALTDTVVNDWNDRILLVDRSAVRFTAGADVTLLSGGIASYLSALSEVKLNYTHYATRDVFSGLVGTSTWDETTSPAVSVGEVDHNGGLASFLLQAKLQYKIVFTTPANAQAGRLKYRVRISIDDDGTERYVKRLASMVYGFPSYELATWTTTPSFVEFFTDSAWLSGETYLYNFSFHTPPLPATGEMTIDFNFAELQGINAVIPNSGTTEYTPTWEFFLPYGEVYTDGTISGQSNALEFKATNDNDTNSDKFAEEVIVGSGPTSTAFGRIEIFTGSVWTLGTTFVSQLGIDPRPHTGMVAAEIITPRLHPAQRIEGTLIGSVTTPRNIIERGGTRYIFQRGTIDLRRDETNGTWVFITDVSTLATVPETGVEILTPLPGPPLPPGPFVPPTPAPGWAGGTIDGVSTRLGLDNTPGFYTGGLRASGDPITALTVLNRDVIHPFFVGDTLTVTHPATGQTQAFTVAGNETDKTISVDSTTADFDTPAGSVVGMGPGWFIKLLTKLRRQDLPIMLVPNYLDVPADNSLAPFNFDNFFVVPEWMNGYLVAKYTLSVATAGDTGDFTASVSVGGVPQTTLMSFASLQVTKTYAPYQALSTGDIITVGISAATDTGTRPKGLVINFQIIATI
jgi:hypothetical protein